MNADEIFALSDDELAVLLEPMTPAEVAAVMMTLQNHVDDLNARRGVVASVYSRKVEEALAAKKFADLSDDALQAELARRKANAQTITIAPIINPHPMGNQPEEQ